MGLPGGGPAALVTELGVFDFPGGRMRLRELFPDVELDEVHAATGFEVDVAGDLRGVTPPSDAEIAVVRSVDRLGVRRTEFGERELQRRFRWSAHNAGCPCCT